MAKALESFRLKIETALRPHGAIGQFCQKVGVSRTTVQAWIKGTPPSLDLIEKAADALGTTPWELIKPEGSQSSALAPQERKHLEKFRRLRPELQTVLDTLIDGLLAKQESDPPSK